MNDCHSWCSISVKRHHDHENSYLGRVFLQFDRVVSSSSWQRAWQHPGRHGAGEVATSSISDL